MDIKQILNFYMNFHLKDDLGLRVWFIV